MSVNKNELKGSSMTVNKYALEESDMSVNTNVSEGNY
jgi:hypothetical protein